MRPSGASTAVSPGRSSATRSKRSRGLRQPSWRSARSSSAPIDGGSTRLRSVVPPVVSALAPWSAFRCGPSLDRIRSSPLKDERSSWAPREPLEHSSIPHIDRSPRLPWRPGSTRDAAPRGRRRTVTMRRDAVEYLERTIYVLLAIGFVVSLIFIFLPQDEPARTTASSTAPTGQPAVNREPSCSELRAAERRGGATCRTATSTLTFYRPDETLRLGPERVRLLDATAIAATTP